MTPAPGRITITGAGAEDVGILAALHEACFDEAWTGPDFARLLAMPGSFGLLAGDGSAMLGLTVARCAAGEAEILTIGVVPAVRRNGIARTLLAEAFHLMKAAGADQAFIEVAADNEPALGLYRDIGFVEVGRRKEYYVRYNADPADALTMRCVLPARAPGDRRR